MVDIGTVISAVYAYVFVFLLILLLFFSHYLTARNEHKLIQYGERKTLKSHRWTWGLTGFLLATVGYGIIVESAGSLGSSNAQGTPIFAAGVGILVYLISLLTWEKITEWCNDSNEGTEQG